MELALAAWAGLESSPQYVVSLEDAPANSPFRPPSPQLAWQSWQVCVVPRVDGEFHLDALNVRLLEMVARNLTNRTDAFFFCF